LLLEMMPDRGKEILRCDRPADASKVIQLGTYVETISGAVVFQVSTMHPRFIDSLMYDGQVQN
jgi:hypothetical protein